MAPERAQEIWRTRSGFGTFAITEEEDAFVRRVWASMAGHTCWADALLNIAYRGAMDPLSGPLQMDGHEVRIGLSGEGFQVFIDDRYEALKTRLEDAIEFARKACSGKIKRTPIIPSNS